MSRKNRKKKRRRDRRREESGMTNTIENNNQKPKAEAKSEEAPVVREENKDTKEDQFEEPPEVLDTEDEKTTEDPFETDSIDMEPSRKGRVISTLIVIVVAIIVIWVFAKNSEETVSEETTTEDIVATETADEENLNPEQKEFTEMTTAALNHVAAEIEAAENELNEKSAQLREKIADYDEEIKTESEDDLAEETEKAQQAIMDTKDVATAALETLRKNVVESEAKEEELENLITDATAEIDNIKNELAQTTTSISSQTIAGLDSISSEAMERNQEKISANEPASEEAEPTTETESIVAETEVVEVDYPEEAEETKITDANDNYTEVAAAGDSVTSLARQAIKKAIDSGDLSGDFNSEHRVYMEDYLRRQIDKHWLDIGDSITFSPDLMNSAATKAQALSEKELANLKQYSTRVTW